MPALPTAADDLDLARKAVRGGRDAFDAVIVRHGPAVLRYLTRMLGGGEDAMDAYQDTFLSAYRAISSLRDPARLRGWLLQIAANTARRRFRTRRAEPDVRPIDADIDPEDREREPIPARVAAHENTERIRDALTRLPDRQREVLSLRTDAGLSYAEIAVALDIREDNARANHYQALKTLRGMIETQDPVPSETPSETPTKTPNTSLPTRPTLRKLP